MSAILDALAVIADPLSNAAYIRQESALQPTQLGYTNDAAGITKWDTSTSTLLTARAAGVEVDLDNAAGAYTWPFDSDTLAAVWPAKSAAQRTQAAEEILTLAVDVTQRRVIGDLVARADKRAGLPYSEQAKLIYAEAQSILNTAILKITNAVTRSDDGLPGDISTPPKSSGGGLRAKWY